MAPFMQSHRPESCCLARFVSFTRGHRWEAGSVGPHTAPNEPTSAEDHSRSTSKYRSDEAKQHTGSGGRPAINEFGSD
jgi:hypothetical protein